MKTVSRKWYISSALLAKRYACSSQQARFRKTFGTGKVLFNKRNWNKAFNAGMDLMWLAWVMLPSGVVESIQNTTVYGTRARSDALHSALKDALARKSARA